MNASAVALPTDADFELSAGRLCLDLPNTLGRRPTAEPSSGSSATPTCVTWSGWRGSWTMRRRARCWTERATRPDEAARVLRRAVALREAIYTAIHAVVNGGSRAGRGRGDGQRRSGPRGRSCPDRPPRTGASPGAGTRRGRRSTASSGPLPARPPSC
jgi:hypothetical protein